MKKAFITGITGQDGSYLAELLLEKGYAVSGLVRRSSTFNTQRIDHLIEKYPAERFSWARGDLTDGDSLIHSLSQFKPDEIYHLAAQSHVKVSFEMPVYSFDTVATGTLRLLESVKILGLDCKIYNACSSEMYGATNPPQNEQSAFAPQSPYAIGKVAAYEMAKLYREAYGMKIYNGLLFNHESPRRGETFVTRKVTRAVARIAYGVQSSVQLGNLNSYRDWGYAPEYVNAMWMMLQISQPDDYVIATGEKHSVREFVEESFRCIGISIAWQGEGLNEKGIVAAIDESKLLVTTKVTEGDTVVHIDERFFRPAEVDSLCGDYTKATEQFGWKPSVSFTELVDIMMKADLVQTDLLLHGTKKADEEWRQFII